MQSWITTPGSNLGFYFTANAGNFQFDSKENSRTSHPAVLTVYLAKTGPQGPPGPAGPAGPVMFLSSVGNGTVANAASLTTNSAGNASTGTIFPIMGYTQTAVAMPQLDTNAGQAYISVSYSGVLQTLPSAVTLTKMSGVINPQSTGIFIGVTLTITAQLYRFQRQGGSGSLIPVPGAACTFTDASTLGTSQPITTYMNIVPPGEIAVCSSTFSASVPAGDSLMFLVSMTTSTRQAQPLTLTLPVDISMALSQ